MSLRKVIFYTLMTAFVNAGRFEYVNGDVYEGEYQAGCRHGKGTMYFSTVF